MCKSERIRCLNVTMATGWGGVGGDKRMKGGDWLASEDEGLQR